MNDALPRGNPLSAQVVHFSVGVSGSEVWVMADSGFQWVTLLRWLRRQGWHFVIRQQGRIWVKSEGRPWRRLSQFELAPGDTRFMGWVR